MKIKHFVLAIIAVFVLVGCNQSPKNLEQYFQSDDSIKEEIESIADENSNSTGKMAIEAKKNTLYYTFTFTETYESSMVDLLKPSFEEVLEQQASTFTDLIKDLEEETKLTGISIVISYNNGDNTAIASKTFTLE